MTHTDITDKCNFLSHFSKLDQKLPYNEKVWAGGKFGEFGELSAIHQTKTIRLVLQINNLLADLLIHQTFICQMLETSQFAKLSHYTVI